MKMPSRIVAHHVQATMALASSPGLGRSGLSLPKTPPIHSTVAAAASATPSTILQRQSAVRTTVIQSREIAAHVQASMERSRNPNWAPITRHTSDTEDVAYQDLRGSGPPPPPKRPIFALTTHDATDCKLRNLHTGNTKEAGTMYGIFVRMRKDGDIYVSEMSSKDIRTDSHPTLAANTAEGRLGLKTVVAAGEIGIIQNEIVGHNDKTGHFQTRRNRQQSGLPPDRFYPFTINPKQWYRPQGEDND